MSMFVTTNGHKNGRFTPSYHVWKFNKSIFEHSNNLLLKSLFTDVSRPTLTENFLYVIEAGQVKGENLWINPTRN